MQKPRTARPWYRFQNEVKDGDTTAELFVYDFIGDSWDGESVTAKRFVGQLNALPKSVDKIVVHINSPGGSVFDAVAIANVLREHRANVNVSIEGLAASAATILAMGGDVVRIAENALFMIHDPYGFAVGGAHDMRKMADALDRVRDAIVATYRWHSPLEAGAISDLMADTTWMTASEAVDRGFAEEVGAPAQAQAHLDDDVAAVLGDVPERFRAVLEASSSVKVAPPPIATAPAVDTSSPPIDGPTATERGSSMMTDEEIQAAIAKSRTDGFEEGRTAERDRILGVEGALIQGHEKLVAELKRDGSITPGEAALRVNAAERAGRDRVLNAIRQDGETTAAVAATVTNAGGETSSVDDPRKPIEERAKLVWDNSPDIREEFELGGFGSYLAWRIADAAGHARVLKVVK